MYYNKIRLKGLYTIDLPIFGLKSSDGYILKGADGLGPTGVDVFMASQAQPGGTYQGRRPQSREIVLLVGLIPNYSGNQTPADMRTFLYGLLSPGLSDSIEVQLLADTQEVVRTIGYVKSLEVVPFTKDPQVQITITCPNPYLESFNPVNVTPPTNASIFTINNTGSAPSGFSMSFTLGTDTNLIVISRVGANPSREIRLKDGLFNAGETVTIDTRIGRRGIFASVGSLSESRLSYVYVDGKTDWHQLLPGQNQFNISMSYLGSPHTNFAWTSVFYLPQHWGV